MAAVMRLVFSNILSYGDKPSDWESATTLLLLLEVVCIILIVDCCENRLLS